MDEGSIMVKRRSDQEGWSKFLMVAVPVATFIGGMTIKGFSIVSQIATVPYVDSKAEELTALAKAREMAILDKAIDHSDKNKQDMLMELKSQGADVKTIDAKQTLMLDTLRMMQQNESIVRKTR